MATECPLRDSFKGKREMRSMGGAGGKAMSETSGERKRDLLVTVKVSKTTSNMKIKLQKKFGVIDIVFGKPSEQDVAAGLRDVCEKFKNWERKLRLFKNGFLAEFPS